MKMLIAFLLASAPLGLIAQQDTLRFEVSGNCEMCKETIEETLDVKGVSFAEWDEGSGKILVVFNNAKISEMEIHHLLANAGYETDKVKANPKAYANLPKCCKYTSRYPKEESK